MTDAHDETTGGARNAEAGTTPTGPYGSGPTREAPGPGGTPVPPDEPRLHRGGRGRMLGGVAVGLADYFGVDPTVVRIAFVALALVGGLAVPLYLAGWALIPDEETETSLAEEFLGRERARGAW